MNHTVTIGIPVFNEGANIKQLLASVLSQKERGFKLREILVISDGSTDDTVRFARSIKDKRIKIIADKKRLGKSARLQQIFAKNRSDMLFLMDGDIAIVDTLLLSRIIKSTDFLKAGLVSVNATPLPAVTTFEQIVEVGVNIMKDIRTQWRNGENYLPFKGCFLGMHKSLVSKTHIPSEVVSNDSYLYFNAVENGFTTKYVDNLFVYYRSPRSFADHKKQASRHSSSRKEMAKYFDFNWDHEYTIPVKTIMKATTKAFIKQPLLLPAYLGVALLSKMTKQADVTNLWSVAYSTKEVISYA